MNESRPDVVFDCNILFQAMARAGGPSAKALGLVERNAVTLYLSRAILREFRRIMEYPEIRERNPELTDAVIDAFIKRLLFRGELRRTVPHVFDYPRDPGDEPYIDLAAAVRADYLATRDNDLLSLMVDHSVEAPRDEITPGTIGQIDASGCCAWHFRKSHLFITKQVALEIQRAGFTSMQYTGGFSGFGGTTLPSG